MSKICIHIGTHKTATTHIQALFEKNAALLARHGVIYPKLKSSVSNHHHVLNGVWNKNFSDDPDAIRNEWRALGQKYANSTKTVFVSSEELSRLRPASTQIKMAELYDLVSNFDEAILLCSFRNQASFVQSIYQQVAHTRGGSPWAGFYKKAMQNRACEGLGLDYNRLFSHFLSGFDRRKIRLISYDHEIHQPGGMVAAIMREIGCTLDPAKLRPITAEQSNVSEQPLTSLIAAQIAAPLAPSIRQTRVVASVIDTYFDTPAHTTLFNRAELAQMVDMFTPTNAALAERIAPFQPSFEVGHMIPLDADVTRDMLDEGFWMALIRRMSHEEPM